MKFPFLIVIFVLTIFAQSCKTEKNRNNASNLESNKTVDINQDEISDFKKKIILLTGVDSIFEYMDIYEDELLTANVLQTADGAGYYLFLDSIIIKKRFTHIPYPTNLESLMMKFSKVHELQKNDEDFQTNETLQRLTQLPKKLLEMPGPVGPSNIAIEFKNCLTKDELNNDFYQECMLLYLLLFRL
ncbi:hypothetical protein GC194_05925 [bacterium]|nr:hypothetical protein [bacterium]